MPSSISMGEEKLDKDVQQRHLTTIGGFPLSISRSFTGVNVASGILGFRTNLSVRISCHSAFLASNVVWRMIVQG